jgi:hypothetical protein
MGDRMTDFCSDCCQFCGEVVFACGKLWKNRMKCDEMTVVNLRISTDLDREPVAGLTLALFSTIQGAAIASLVKKDRFSTSTIASDPIKFESDFLIVLTCHLSLFTA